jgi:hypothetical protein
MDSCGKADRFRAVRSFVGFGCFTVRVGAGDLLSVGRLGGVEALERRAARLAGLRTGLVFPVGVPKFSLTDFPISHSLAGERTGDHSPLGSSAGPDWDKFRGGVQPEPRSCTASVRPGRDYVKKARPIAQWPQRRPDVGLHRGSGRCRPPRR